MPYLPSKPPPTSSDDGTALAFYLEDELSRLAMSLLDDVQAVEVRPAHSAPLRPREGMVVYADGTDWNPGAGEGLYTYGSDGVWHLLNEPVLAGNVPKSYLQGLTLSTAGASATFGVAAGSAADSTNVNSLALASAFTKTTSAWALGTGNGALDTGAIANSTWYHAYLIKRVDTKVVDVLISLSATAPTLPTNYTLFRRIGSMKTNGSAQWTLFHQFGDDFLWDQTVGDLSSTNPGTASALRTLTVPTGVQVWAQLGVIIQVGAATDGRGWIVSPDMPDQGAPGSSTFNFGGISSAATGTLDWICQATVRTNTSAQVRTRLLASDANTVFVLTTRGWFDRRGRDL